MKFCLLRSRLAYVIPAMALIAATFSVLHNARYCFLLMTCGMVVVMAVPSAIFTMKKEGNGVVSTDGSREMMLHPASVFEKILAQALIALMVLALAFGLHAAAFALGLNGVSSVAADGFEPGTLAIMLLFVWLAALISNIQFKTSRGDVSNVGFFTVVFSGAVIQIAFFGPQMTMMATAIIFAAGLVALCLHYFAFKHRNIKY